MRESTDTVVGDKTRSSGRRGGSIPRIPDDIGKRRTLRKLDNIDPLMQDPPDELGGTHG
jgi:hypothetical protein